MNIPFIKKSKTLKHKKDGRINPHHFMLIFVSVLLFIIIVEIVVFSYFFMFSSRKLDSEVAPKPNTNTAQIRKIEKSIQKTEETVSARQGIVAPSQNEDPIVQ